jgi:hypothetical protein
MVHEASRPVRVDSFADAHGSDRAGSAGPGDPRPTTTGERPRLLGADDLEALAHEDVVRPVDADELEPQLSLRVVHVLSRPESGWPGERGRVSEQLLRRYAPRDVARWSALVCGPSAMVAEAASALQRLGMPPAAIQAEGFA